MSIHVFDSFKTFCTEMYYANQVEREHYHEEPITYEKYVEENMKFLLEVFSKKEE